MQHVPDQAMIVFYTKNYCSQMSNVIGMNFCIKFERDDFSELPSRIPSQEFTLVTVHEAWLKVGQDFLVTAI